MSPSAASAPLHLLQAGARQLGLDLSPAVLPALQFYCTTLLQWNRRVNLTGLRTAADVMVRHFVDSLAVWRWVHDLADLADLGSGAGFPGLPLKIVFPHLHLTLVEAHAKKAAFLQYLVAHLALSGVEVRQVHLTPALAQRWGPVFQGIITRATWPLDRYVDLAAPLLRPGGRLLAMRGPREEVDTWHRALESGHHHGLSQPREEEYELPMESGRRRLVLWTKEGS